MRKPELSRLAGALLAFTVALTACTMQPTLVATAVPAAPAMVTTVATPTATLPALAPQAELLARATLQQMNGDYEAAAAGLSALIDSGAPVEVQREALLRAGRAELQAGAYAAAAAHLERLVRDYPTDPELPLAYFGLGEARLGLDDGQGAAAAYRGYLERRPLLVTYVEQRIGRALAQAGDQAGAAAAFRAAADAEANASSKAALVEECARALAALERYDEAVAAFGEALDLAQTAAGRAEIMFELGGALRDAGRQSEAAARWNELVASYPLTAYAAQALAVLDGWHAAAAGALTRAQVEYGAGRYQGALDILRDYAATDGHLGDAHYWAALANRRLEQHAASVRELEALIVGHPQNDLLVEAWYEKAQSQALAGSMDGAVATFRALAARYPQSARAVEAL
ncbi:MAG TPA: tetratricopeptide repeat protein, partial [Anaerolineae bacterium]|nr:tetratricopeptide repeat protein [Anaerolineae bacterium]